MTKIIIDTDADTKLEAKVKKILEEKNIGYKISDSKNKKKTKSGNLFQKKQYKEAEKELKKFRRAMIKW